MSEKQELLPSQERFSFATGKELDQKLREAAHRSNITRGKLVRQLIEEGISRILDSSTEKPCLELDTKLFTALETVSGKLGLTCEGLIHRMILDHLGDYLQVAKESEEKVSQLEEKIKNITKVSKTEKAETLENN